VSGKNETDGAWCYCNGSKETRDWFEQQWALWPKRVHDKRTTNGSFHYGALRAYREEHGDDPFMSPEFAAHVRVMDGFAKEPHP
jgi:hypothetical protein